MPLQLERNFLFEFYTNPDLSTVPPNIFSTILREIYIPTFQLLYQFLEENCLEETQIETTQLGKTDAIKRKTVKRVSKQYASLQTLQQTLDQWPAYYQAKKQKPPPPTFARLSVKSNAISRELVFLNEAGEPLGFYICKIIAAAQNEK